MRTGGFPAPDEDLDLSGVGAAAALAPLAEPVALLTSPVPAARATAAALGVATMDEVLRDQAHGAWAGLGFAEIPAAEFAAWLANPACGAPGGESLDAVAARIRPWLEARAADATAVVAVTHPMVIRAALAAALDATSGAVMRIDIAPLSQVRLSFNRTWRLQALVPMKRS